MEYFNATLNNSKDQLKIKPFECFTKIQEARPAHCSTLVNKELGYDAIIDIGGEDNCLKIKNCICSARSNS